MAIFVWNVFSQPNCSRRQNEWFIADQQHRNPLHVSLAQTPKARRKASGRMGQIGILAKVR